MTDHGRSLNVFLMAILLVFIVAIFAVLSFSQEVPPVTPKCEWVQTPWGGSHCDVTSECSLTLMPMHIGSPPTPVYVTLITEETIFPDPRIAPIESGAKTANIEFDKSLKWAEWYITSSRDEERGIPQHACYCDEKRNMIVICVNGEIEKEIEQ